MHLGVSAIFSFTAIVSNILAFSDEEKSALEKLRPLVKDVLYRDFMKEDLYLIQWLRVTSLDTSKANERIRKTHLWRQENNIDTIIDEDFSQMEKEFPYTIGGHDKEGRLLMYLNFGATWDLRKAVLRAKGEEFNRHLYRIFEICAKKARETFNETVPTTATGIRDVPDWSTFHDLKGYTLRQNGCLGCIPRVLAYAAAGDKYLVYSVKNIYSVNTPRIFESVLQLIRNIISEHTNNLLKVYGLDQREFLEHLSKDIATDQLKLYFKL